jgi:hypothetical protein
MPPSRTCRLRTALQVPRLGFLNGWTMTARPARGAPPCGGSDPEYERRSGWRDEQGRVRKTGRGDVSHRLPRALHRSRGADGREDGRAAAGVLSRQGGGRIGSEGSSVTAIGRRSAAHGLAARCETMAPCRRRRRPLGTGRAGGVRPADRGAHRSAPHDDREQGQYQQAQAGLAKGSHHSSVSHVNTHPARRGSTDPTRCPRHHRFTRRNRSALPITDTELKLMAAAASIGLSNSPVNGYSTPAAIGTHAAL